MDFAFANMAFAGEQPQQHSSHEPSAKPPKPARRADNTSNTMERQEPRRVPSSVYSRSVNQESASTYWTAEAPPSANPMLTQHQSKAQPLSPPVGPRMANPDARLALSGGAFREEHAQIDDMIRHLTCKDEQGDASLHDDHGTDHETGDDVPSPMLPTPKGGKKGHRDMSDRSLRSLVPTKATLELVEHIVRIAWDGNLQDRLCEVALAIHKDLRGCFHNNPITHETANRATQIVGEINLTVNCWLGQMRALQEAIRKIDVKRDTPNFMQLHKDVHGKEIKKFRLMLSPIPTQLGAECNAKIAGLMYRLFYDEVRDPFQHEMNAKPSPSASEQIIMSYFMQLGKQLVKVQMAAEHLNSATLTCWEQWTAMSAEIAKHAALMHSKSPAAVALRAKGAVARVFNHGKRRSGGTKTVPARSSTSRGRVEISKPIPRPEPRRGAVRDTLVVIPTHPLDATGELDEDERQLIREKIASAPSTPLTPHFNPHERNRGFGCGTVQAGQSSPPVVQDGLRWYERCRPEYERSRPSYVPFENAEFEETGYGNPFLSVSSNNPNEETTDDVPEYFHHRPGAPSLSDQIPSDYDLFARSSSLAPECTPRNTYEEGYASHDENAYNGNDARLFENFSQYAADHHDRAAAEYGQQEEEPQHIHNMNIPPHHHGRLRRVVSSPVPSSGRPSIEGVSSYGTLTAVHKTNPFKPDANHYPERNEIWNRAMTLRRLEGGPPAEPPEIFEPTPAMYAVQRGVERKRELDRRQKQGRVVQELRREERRLEREIDDIRSAKGKERAGMRSPYHGGGYGDGGSSGAYGDGLGIGSAGHFATAGHNREKMALRESMSVGGSSGASNYSGVPRSSSLRRSASVGCHSGVPSRSGSRQSGKYNNNGAVVVGASRRRRRSSGSSSGTYGPAQSRSREHDRSEQRQQRLLPPIQQEFSGIFRDSEGHLVEGNMRDGYRYVDEEHIIDSYTRLESAGYYDDEQYDYNNEGSCHEYTESLTPLVQRTESLDPLCQPRVPNEAENPDLFGDVDHEMYATDEEEPWRRV
ncbi:uncharacterized protein BKCO1_3100015 [Diplodia corticola]|uniref:Uncharacterized protein n=1 Tax=Diplodia corticola TaxID=236234 RepID=A0A1J9S103_9PEZI|nr:uncharacterized protein BKCO1_3100015 [Diplodia corticola]OJD33341.1 hypothetical protein BKCO1_3100015 [Diplodia corticola]